MVRSQLLPVAAKEPALFMGLLYFSCATLNAMKGCSETPLSMAIKAEAMKQINLRFNDHKTLYTSVTIASIAYMSSGVYVRIMPPFLYVITNGILGLWIARRYARNTST